MIKTSQGMTKTATFLSNEYLENDYILKISLNNQKQVTWAVN